MRSPEHAADLERVLTRAAKECQGKTSWFGEGLATALRQTLEAAGQPPIEGPPEIAFVDARRLATENPPKLGIPHVVALSDAAVSELAALVRAAESSRFQVTRLVCPFAVLDLGREGLRVRELRKGLTATDLQAHLDTPLWAGPDLKQMGTG